MPAAPVRRPNTLGDIPLPITYTPTTHRISKAKKGKRVHACEYPGCNKVFTRAEHRRRHELNHNPEASFRCTYEGCRRAFHRSDLLARHMERHELDGQSDSSATRQTRSKHTRSVTSVPSNLVSSMPASTQSPPYPMTPMSMPVSSTPVSSTGSVAGPASTIDSGSNFMLSWNGMEIPIQPRPSAVFGSHVQDSPDDLSFYSSPDSCRSPVSEIAGYGMPPIPPSTPTSVMDSYNVVVFNPEICASPLQLPVTSCEWNHMDLMPVPDMMPLALDSDNFVEPALQSPYLGNRGLEMANSLSWQ
ncbi:hypothetical protein VTN31DRAFT_1597 [Thermomyces dupontii]|uniref:uncharacterized protein n=1 Tax=Talaromyces thermophilus TaxID=28565 RepID=UPI00374410D9